QIGSKKKKERKKDSTICCLQETHLIEKDIHRLKVKGWEKSYHSHEPRKQAGVSILISNKADFKLNSIKKDEEGHYILLKGTIHQQDLTILNICAPNNEASTFIKQTLPKFKSQIDHNIIILGDFNTPLSSLDRSSKQKLNKETIKPNNTINNLDLTDIYRIIHPSTRDYTFFSAAHGSFSKIDHILCHKATLSKYKKVEILPCILSDHNGMKSEINDKIKNEIHSNTWRLNYMLLNEQWITEDIKEEIKKFLEVNENIDKTYQNLWDTMKAVLRGKFFAWSSFFKRRKSQQINDLTLHLKALEKEEQINTQKQQKTGNN
uniref:exodeoxyribonuclease III n=1 Tax=Marmota marmota marmota TaxID=9994 RepID=A0A8C5ZAA1_MARMA